MCLNSYRTLAYFKDCDFPFSFVFLFFWLQGLLVGAWSSFRLLLMLQMLLLVVIWNLSIFAHLPEFQVQLGGFFFRFIENVLLLLECCLCGIHCFWTVHTCRMFVLIVLGFLWSVFLVGIWFFSFFWFQILVRESCWRFL